VIFESIGPDFVTRPLSREIIRFLAIQILEEESGRRPNAATQVFIPTSAYPVVHFQTFVEIGFISIFARARRNGWHTVALTGPAYLFGLADDMRAWN